MKVAVSPEGSALDSAMGPRFGQREGFALSDNESRRHSYLDNSTQRSPVQGAGKRAAAMIVA